MSHYLLRGTFCSWSPVLHLIGLAVAGVSLITALPACGGDQVERSKEHDFVVRTLVSGLYHPWGMAFLPGGGVLVTERSGTLYLISDGFAKRTEIAGLPEIAETGQGGLLDVALHPDFAENRLVYFSYAAEGGDGVGTEVARGRLNGHRLEEVSVIFRALPKSDGGRHFGSRLLFDAGGYLYITLGDRGNRSQAQALGTHPGSIIRVHDDGSVPQDNPFLSVKQARPEIYTYGNRNVQGIALQPGSGQVWAHEHGPQGGDEINIVRAGINYGWPVITYGRNYWIGTKIGEGTRKDGMAQPVYQWTPSIAPSGMTFYEGDKFPRWRGDILAGSLKFKLLVRLSVDGERVTEEEHLLADRYGRIRDVRSGPDGYVYLLTDDSNGQLLRLEPAVP